MLLVLLVFRQMLRLEEDHIVHEAREMRGMCLGG